jgi:hypothetical protein
VKEKDIKVFEKGRQDIIERKKEKREGKDIIERKRERERERKKERNGEREKT